MRLEYKAPLFSLCILLPDFPLWTLVLPHNPHFRHAGTLILACPLNWCCVSACPLYVTCLVISPHFHPNPSFSDTWPWVLVQDWSFLCLLTEAAMSLYPCTLRRFPSWTTSGTTVYRDVQLCASEQCLILLPPGITLLVGSPLLYNPPYNCLYTQSARACRHSNILTLCSSNAKRLVFPDHISQAIFAYLLTSFKIQFLLKKCNLTDILVG